MYRVAEPSGLLNRTESDSPFLRRVVLLSLLCFLPLGVDIYDFSVSQNDIEIGKGRSQCRQFLARPEIVSFEYGNEISLRKRQSAIVGVRELERTSFAWRSKRIRGSRIPATISAVLSVEPSSMTICSQLE